MPHGPDRLRLWAYVLVATAGLLAGMALGQIAGARRADASRVQWPAPPAPHPRSLNP
jgi:hypothetical protein